VQEKLPLNRKIAVNLMLLHKHYKMSFRTISKRLGMTESYVNDVKAERGKGSEQMLSSVFAPATLFGDQFFWYLSSNLFHKFDRHILKSRQFRKGEKPIRVF